MNVLSVLRLILGVLVVLWGLLKGPEGGSGGGTQELGFQQEGMIGKRSAMAMHDLT